MVNTNNLIRNWHLFPKNVIVIYFFVYSDCFTYKSHEKFLSIKCELKFKQRTHQKLSKNLLIKALKKMNLSFG